MTALVERWGRTGFAAVTSLVWALPFAAWAGSVDLAPGPGPWIAFGIGAVLLVAWLGMLTRLGAIQIDSTRPRRLDLARMSGSEKRWNLGLAVFATALIAWLNGAATVDWRVLTVSLSGGRAGPFALALGLLAFLAAAVAGTIVSWRRSAAAFRLRAALTPSGSD